MQWGCLRNVQVKAENVVCQTSGCGREEDERTAIASLEEANA